MNVLFLSISSLPHMSEHSISLDLIHEFQRHGHKIFVLCALEKKENKDTYLCEENGCQVLRVKIGNNKKANLIEKGLTTLFLPTFYINAIKKYYSNVKFDLVMYPTPPVTQVSTVKYVKKRDGAVSYLLLKDIFPQNAVDIGMMSNRGIKGIIYNYFRRVEKNFYKVSDYIGCMSQANVDYVLKHNPEVKKDKVEVCPNSIEVIDKSVDKLTCDEIRKKYNIPLDKKVFVYGGNLGKPQGIPFLIDCLKSQKDNDKVIFLIVGDGTEYGKLEAYIKKDCPNNVILMKRLPKEDYDTLVAACDVGLIFLDHRFTIPNFPSRLLSYMQAKIPVLAVTDPNTDIGKVIVENKIGWWVESNSIDQFAHIVDIAINQFEREDITVLQAREFDVLDKLYSVTRSYETIVNSLSK